MMSMLRKCVIAAFAAGTILAAPSAALASTGLHAAAQQVAAGESTSASTAAAPANVHRAPCAALTFNVYHGHAPRPLCYAGAGTIKPDIQAAYKITTGRYWGCLEAHVGKTVFFRSFKPHLILRFPSDAELAYFKLAGHPVLCTV